MSRFKHALMGMASMSVLATGAAYAQDSAGESEVIVVQGIRQSLQQSIEAKRESDAIVDVITATDIGRFPDKNVAESLQRLTGISIQREYGEGERVAIRGIASNRNLTQMNGHAVATADWFILDQLSATRSFNYLMLPSEIVGSVEVYKSGQANIDEGGVGGTVNVTTRRPLDLPSGDLRVSLQGAYSELADSMTPYASGMYSWANENETFGILLAGVYQEREIRRDGLEILGYSSRSVTDQGGANFEVPDLIGSALFTQTRERIGGNLTAQFRPNHRFDGALNIFYTEMQADNVNYNYMAWVSQMMGAGSQPTNTTTGAGGTLLSGTFASNPAANGVVFDTIVRDARTQTQSIDFDFDYQLSDNWNFHGKIGFTEAEGATESQPFWEANAPTGLTYDLSSGVPQVSFTDIDPTSMTDAQSMVLGWASLNIIENFDEEFFAYGDLTREFASGPFENIQIGGRYSKHERDVVVTYGQTRSLLDAAGSPACGGARCTLATVSSGATTPGDFLSGLGGNPLSNFLLPDVSAIRNVYSQLSFGTDFPDFFHSGPLDSFTVTEEVTAGYVMGEFDVDRIRGNVGVRIVNTEQTVDGFSVGVDPATPGSFDNPFGRTVRTQDTNSYTDILPSANLVFEISDDILLRGSASRVMARADYNQLAGAVSLTNNLLTGRGGNPALDPFRATAFDFGFEWYRGDDSLLAVALFYKDLESYITNSTFTERHPLSIANPADPRIANAANNCASTPSGSDPNLYTCDFQVTRPVNGPGGTNHGLEVSYQQPLANGFGFIANYTYSDAESDNGDPIPENSTHQYNLIGYFENEHINGRLSLNHRDEFFIGVDRNRELYHQPITTLDGSLTWYATDNYAFTVEAVNITEETLEQYYVNEGRPARLYDNGRVVFFGVKASF